jgi:hypothetical protein
MGFITRTISAFWLMPWLNSGVTAKQIRSDSTMQITPMTVLFLRKLIA